MTLWLLAGALEAAYVLILLLGNLKEQVVRFIPLALAAGLLYLISVWLVFRPLPAVGRWTLRFIFVAGLVFRATLFPLYPALSDDLMRYRWDGKMQVAGYNPYLLPPADPQLEHLRDETYQGVAGKHHVAIYGPFTELLFRFWYPVAMTPGSVYLSVLLMKVPMLAFDFGTALLLVRLLGQLKLPKQRVLVYWWSPLTVVEFAASGHNDSLAVFFLVLALVGLVAGEKAWSLVALGLSTLSKLFTAFLWPVVLARWMERGRWRELLLPVACGVVGYWSFREGLFQVVPGLSVFAEKWRNNDSLFGIFYALTGSHSAASAAFVAIAAGMAGFLAGRRVALLRAAFLILGVTLVCAANVFPWYLTWILPLLAIFPNPAWLLFTVLAFLFYEVLISYATLGVWEDNPVIRLLVYVPFYTVLLGGWIAGRRKTNSEEPLRSAHHSSIHHQ